MSCGTLQPNLVVGAARPSAGGFHLVLGIFDGFATSIRPAVSNPTWMKQWNGRPAYQVTHTDRPVQRPLERSP
jgi:hypothetical protein